MALDTYANLQTSIAEFLNRQDLTAAIPSFITLAEAQIQRDIRHWRRENRATAILTDQYIALPADFYSMVSMHIHGDYRRSLNPINRAGLQDLRYRSGDVVGEPTHYVLTGGEIELYPTPADGTIELTYMQTIPALSYSNASNWLLAEAPDVYLYGALSQSAPYLKDDERLIIWSTLYTNAVNALNATSDRAKYGQNLKMRVAHG